MSELISGKEALNAWYDGLEVEVKNGSSGWFVFNDHNFGMRVFKSQDHQFRLKPRTIKIEIEIPTPFAGNLAPKQYAHVLNTRVTEGYSSIKYYEGNPQPLLCWINEEEIKQVVAALRGAIK